MKIAPILYLILQGSTLLIFSILNPQFFDFSTISFYYFAFVMILSLIFYGLTSFKDPGYLIIRSPNNTDCSNQMTQKRKIFQFSTLPSNARTYPIIEQQNPIQEQKSENEQELPCEASLDINQLPEFDMNQIPSFTKTPDKYPSPNKQNNQQKIFQDFDTKQASTQAFSITSQNEHETIVPITNNDKQKDVDIEKQEENVCQKNKNEEKIMNKNLQPSLTIQVHSVQNEFISEQYSPGMSERNKITQSTRAVNKILIEKRYCPICSIDQLARAKHCQSCKKCVACYDHHCPWAGNCIGERNRCVYYWFLVFQIQEIYYAFISTLQNLEFDNYNHLLKFFSIYFFTIIIFFGVLVTRLLCFQTFLSFQNLTTWEFYSWNKISYLQELKRKNGSPFSYGWINNIQIYCRFKIPQLTIWEYNPERVYK
ncbi:unnamed protein product [Paramecium pentaurelia]|uniref:Palmitoyltransferase n=1 Tax=Paramecium pentaurelia TaxID=43138 RepID=A0A8S1VF92_9CILI|nr:unnamed protein product [Paramecium pentaurelia]